MRTKRIILAAALAFSLVLTGCGDDTDSTTSPDGDASRTPTSQAAGAVPDPGRLAGMLPTAQALGEGWVEQPPPGEAAVETPGVVPEEERGNLPRPQFCDSATVESKEAAEDLAWQAVRIFTLPLDENPRNHQVFVQEFLLAGEEATIGATYTALAAGFAACETEETDYGDGVVGRNVPMPPVTLGTEAVGVHELVEEPSPRGPAVWDLRSVFAHDGPVLVWVQLGDVRVGKDVQPQIDDDATEDILAAVSDAMG